MRYECCVHFYQCDALNVSSCSAVVTSHLHNKFQPLYINQKNHMELAIKFKNKFLATLNLVIGTVTTAGWVTLSEGLSSNVLSSE